MKRKNFIKSLITILLTTIVSIIIIVFVNKNYNKKEETNNSNLPELKMDFDFVKYNFDGNFAYDIEELINSNPWKINERIHTLPVFENKISYNDYSVSRVIDLDSMRERFKEVIIMLKINPDDIINANGIEITEDFLENKNNKDKKEKNDLLKEDLASDIIVIDRIDAYTEKYRIIVYPNLSAKVIIQAEESDIDKYNLTPKSTYEEVLRTAEYLKEEYIDKLGMKEPVINIFNRGYNLDGDRIVNISFFEGQGSLEEKIINYSLNEITFKLDGRYNEINMEISSPDLSKKIGDYPIISQEEAKNLLIKSKYISFSQKYFPGEEYIRDVELIYRGEYEKYFIPYYKFNVEIVDIDRGKDEKYLKLYSSYLVPAIEKEYIKDFN